MRPRAVIAVGVVVGFLAALILASSPRLHEQVHPGSAQHECAATMIGSGNCEHATPPTMAPEIPAAPISSPFLPRELAPFRAAANSSVLEHAPPFEL